MKKKVLINYSTKRFIPYQKFNTLTGKLLGKFDECIPYRPHHLDSDFSSRNKRILTHKRGAGYWLWKPYIIHKTLKRLEIGDYLFYSDSGTYFVSSIDPLIHTMEEHQTDIFILGWGFLEKQYTKRDAFVILSADEKPITDSPQRFASSLCLKKSAFTMKFTAEYLQYAQDERVISDMPNQMGWPNYPEFVAHRHDQSIFSLLSKKYNVPLISKKFFKLGDCLSRGQIINQTRMWVNPLKRLIIFLDIAMK